MKEKISQVIVVEGRDDTANLKRYFDVETYETRGSAINEQDLERIQRLHQRHGVIVFTDPDFNGERIRRMIMTAIPTVQHAFLKRDEAVPKSKKLLCSQVKIGSQVRQIVSGIKAHYSPEEMVGKKVMVLVNLKPAKLAGVLSEGMILCAEDAEGNLALVTPEKNMPAGAEIC